MNRILLTLPLFALVALAAAQGSKSVAEKNLAAERLATIKGNVAWFEKTMSSDYYEIDRRGRRKSREKALLELKVMLRALKTKSLTAKVQSVQMVGQTMLVMVDSHLVGEVSQGGKKFAIDTTSSTVEAWKQTGGEWQMLSQKTTSEKVKINGKPVN